MQAAPDCIPYALSQVLATARMVTEDEWIHRKVLLRTLADLAEETDLDKSEPEIIFASLATAYKALGVKDPYENEKARCNKAVGALLEEFRQALAESKDRLGTILRLVLAGTVVGIGIHDRDTAEAALSQAQAEPLARDDSENLCRVLNRAESVLYLLNNSGEVMLDQLLITELAQSRKVVVVPRHQPILTDVTVEEACKMGLDKIENVEILDPGAPMLGLWLEKTSNELREHFAKADVVIAKGEANYQSLYQAEREIYFFMHANSPATARHLEVPQGSPVIFRHRPPDEVSAAAKESARKKRASKKK
ncbi:MAG: DUF89 family protein [Planctomycetes bacterium]|nr:DUF89 family protein [Planctomycetota bacterium]